MMEIRSYRHVFDLERRIYRVDRLRLNPGGVPLRGIFYFLAILAMTLFTRRLPLVAIIAHTLPWYALDVVLPGVGAALLTLIKIEGRSFHLAALSLLRYATGPRELAGLRPCVTADRRWRLHELVVLADGSDSRLRRLRYTGPGAVLVSTAHVRSVYSLGPVRRLARRPVITLATIPGKRRPINGQVIGLTVGMRLEVKAAREISPGALTKGTVAR